MSVPALPTRDGAAARLGYTSFRTIERMLAKAQVRQPWVVDARLTPHAAAVLFPNEFRIESEPVPEPVPVVSPPLVVRPPAPAPSPETESRQLADLLARLALLEQKEAATATATRGAHERLDRAEGRLSTLQSMVDCLQDWSDRLIDYLNWKPVKTGATPKPLLGLSLKAAANRLMGRRA